MSQLDENGKEVVIAYGSRTLVGAEVNYPITELEPANISFMIDRCRCPSCRYKGINNLYKMFGLG